MICRTAASSDRSWAVAAMFVTDKQEAVIRNPRRFMVTTPKNSETSALLSQKRRMRSKEWQTETAHSVTSRGAWRNQRAAAGTRPKTNDRRGIQWGDSSGRSG